MKPGKAGFDRIKWCFENTYTGVIPMVLASVDQDGVSLPLEFPESTRAQKLGYKVQTTVLDNIMIPDTTVIRTIGKNDVRWRLNVAELFEWIGMAGIQSERITVHDNIDPYLCVYSNPAQATSERTGSSGYLLEISGFIPSVSILPIFESLRDLLNKDTSTCTTSGWANFTVWGFQDSPISWRDREHGHLLTGENLFSFFLWSNQLSLNGGKENQDKGVYVLLENVGGHDAHS
ncbi:Ribonuclease P protein subunit p40 [Podila epigama]|nr:Ribonuclease P protein subunit p40 [Podila epigama]